MKDRYKRAIRAALGLGCLPVLAASGADLVLVTGAPGDPEFAPRFAEAAESWQDTGRRGGAEVHRVGEGSTPSPLEELGQLVPRLASEPGAPLWIVLLGHGTFDGREAKFNLAGPDLSASTLDGWLAEAKRPVAVINCSAASAPFLKLLSKPGRILVTATKSGSEESYARFGEFLADRIDQPEADLDQDGATSLLEGFLAASAAVRGFYEQEGRLATEEALIDDNGDGLGTPADWFRGVRAVKVAKDGAEPDGRRAHQLQLVPSEEERRLDPELRARRDELEEKLFALRARKESMAEDDYFRELERILQALGEVYAEPGKEDP